MAIPGKVGGSCRGLYQTDRQPEAALQNTAMCPAGAPGVRAASAGPQSHITQDTMILPGPHSCPLLQRSGQHHQPGRRTTMTRLGHKYDCGLVGGFF